MLQLARRLASVASSLPLALTAAPILADTPATSVSAPRPVLLLPLNVEEVPPEYLADGTEIVDGVLAAALEQRGVSFVQPSLVEGIRFWSRAIAGIGGLVVDLDGVDEESVLLARDRLVRNLLAHFDARAIVWPDLLEREGQLRRKELSWDGTTRRLKETAGNNTATAGSSIRIRVYDAQAELVHEQYQGLELIHVYRRSRFRRVGDMYEYYYAYFVRTDLFENDALLQRAVRAALPEVLPR